MVYIETDKDNKVVYQHFFPNELKEEDKQNGYLVDEIPIPTHKEGYDAYLNYTEKRGFWTSYEEIPKSYEVKMQERIDELEAAILELTMKLGSDN